jgi:long-chain acyl-CoA synthetase
VAWCNRQVKKDNFMDKIWFKNYPKQVPFKIDMNLYTSLVDLFDCCCDKYSGQPAFENMGFRLSYAELALRCRDFAAYLQKKLRLKKGDRIAIMLPNLLQYPIVLFAALKLGLIVVNINPLYTSRELVYQLQDSGAETIVILTNFAARLQRVLAQTKIKHIIVTDVADLLGGMKKWLIKFMIKYIKRAIPKWQLDRAMRFSKVLAAGGQLSFDQVVIQSHDVALLQYTGGTTGLIKGAMLTHGNLVANVLQCIAWVDGVLEEGKEIVVTALPLYHIFSLMISCFVFIQLGGMSSLVTNPRDFASFIKQLRRIPFTVFIGVNTLFQGLLQYPKFHLLNFSSLKLSLAGGMAVLKNTAEQWQKSTGHCIIMGYGLTEASPVVTINPLTVTEFSGSIGLPVPSTDIAIRDDAGHDLGINQEGELCVKGPQVMLGYWQQVKETELVFDKEGWLRTGDIVRIDEQGYLYLVDRKKDIILVSGFNVYPNEVEEVIADHPGVAEVAVVGVSNTHSGEVVKAFIVKKDPRLTEADIISYCKTSLTGYKLPKYIEFRNELPKSNVGKVLRQKLREEVK